MKNDCIVCGKRVDEEDVCLTCDEFFSRIYGEDSEEKEQVLNLFRALRRGEQL